MYRSVDLLPASVSEVCRWLGRTSSSVLLFTWIVFVGIEVLRPDPFSLASAYQAAALLVVFAGYLLGWRYEFAGGSLAILGTIAFFAVCAYTLGVAPSAVAISFAVPGVLYVMAWRYGHWNSEQRGHHEHPKNSISDRFFAL
jgi:hypothetical protein